MKPYYYKLRIILVLLLFVILWIYSNWSAISKPWWYLDDYPHMEQLSDSFHRGLINGRPFEGLWFLTFELDKSVNNHFTNILLRLIQGLIHCSAAFLASLLLWKENKNILSFAIFLPFLLWPFNSEAILWRSAGSYPIAALLSICGIICIHSFHKERIKKIAGLIFIIIAILTNQLAALSGICVYLIIYISNCLTQKTNDVKILKNSEVYYLISGYISGGIISYLIAHHFDYTMRSSLTSNLYSKLGYLIVLIKIFISNVQFYPNWLIYFQISILSIAFISLIFIIDKLKYQFGKGLQILLTFMMIFILPFLTLMIVSENWPAFRVLYLAPFIICLGILLIVLLLSKWKLLSIIPYVILIVLIVSYINIGKNNSSEYVSVYNSDLNTLIQIENIANQLKIDKICVSTWPDFQITNWNPYNVKYMYYDSKLSAFLKDYSCEPFIRKFSNLKPITDLNIKRQCLGNVTNIEFIGPFKLGINMTLHVLCFSLK